MSANTSIEWTDRVWNPVRGCRRVSRGCERCYAERVAHRFGGPGQPYEGLTRITNGRPQWTGKITLVESALTEPLKWRKPCRVFVNSMSDLFHEGVSNEFIDQVFAVMALCPQHTFQVLTKRPERMKQFVQSIIDGERQICSAAVERADSVLGGFVAMHALKRTPEALDPPYRPLPNVWPGVSVEDLATADARIPLLLETPAAVRFVSYEPALGPVDFTRLCTGGTVEFDALHGGALIRHQAELPREPVKIDGLNWVIVGGESGAGARPFDVQWARDMIRQCREAGVACFVKQLGARPYQSPERDGGTGFNIRLNDPKGGIMDEWPLDLRVREFPTLGARIGSL